MKSAIRALRAGTLPVCVCLWATLTHAGGGQVRTNYVERWLTNAIEITVPANRFVTEYHTNYILRESTNILNVFATNLVTRQVTHQVPVELVRTNFVVAYQTNYKTLNVTNWTTVLVLKTNWSQQNITNLAEVDMPRNEVGDKTAAKPGPRGNQAGAPAAESLKIEATRGPKAVPANQGDVRLVARWVRRAGAPAQVQQWRVQSLDGSILCFGQDSEFRRTLPIGSYKVEVKAKLDPNGPLVVTRGNLVVTAQEIALEPAALAKQ
jgi:hypothetical protein